MKFNFQISRLKEFRLSFNMLLLRLSQGVQEPLIYGQGLQSSLDLCRVRDSPRVASALHSRPFPHRDRLQKVGQLFMSPIGCDQSHTYPHLAILYFSPYVSCITRKLAHTLQLRKCTRPCLSARGKLPHSTNACFCGNTCRN